MRPSPNCLFWPAEYRTQDAQQTVRLPYVLRKPILFFCRRFLALLELFRRELVPRQQLVEVGAVALRETCRLADIASGDLEDL
jgi:hypothetical protein